MWSLLLLWVAQVDLPGTSSVSVPLAAPVTCRSCHGSFDPGESAYDSWLGSPMAHSARNPLFLSALTEANEDTAEIGAFCLRCHAPDGWLQGACLDPDGGLVTDDEPGVGCAVCHRMDPSPWKRNGQYTLGDDIVYRGPLADANPPHRWQPSSWISSSELCAGCHDLSNPLVVRRDLDGTPMGMLFPEQTTYTEWATSSVAASKGCRDCHLPETTGSIAENAPVRPDRSRHELAGGNLFLLGALDFLEPGLGISDQLARGKLRIAAQLRSAATLALVEAPAEARRGEVVTLRFRVTNQTGHKLPTGYPEGRRVWLEVASSELALARGGFDETTGEPIDPAAIYHVRQGQLGIGPGHRLALNDVVFLDTRIPPLGMLATATTAPVGKVYPEIAPGRLANWDEVTVTATTPCDMGLDAIHLRGALWYQSVTQAYVTALVAENGFDERALRLQAAFEEANPGPFEMASIAETIAIAPDSSCERPDAGHDDAGITDAGDRGPDAEVTPDAGPMMMPEPEGGCGCRTTAGADGSRAFGLILLLGGIAARKRR